MTRERKLEQIVKRRERRPASLGIAYFMVNFGELGEQPR